MKDCYRFRDKNNRAERTNYGIDERNESAEIGDAKRKAVDVAKI